MDVGTVRGASKKTTSATTRIERLDEPNVSIVPTPVMPQESKYDEPTIRPASGPRKLSVDPPRPQTAQSSVSAGDQGLGLFVTKSKPRQVGPLYNSKTFPPNAPWYILNPLAAWRPYWDVTILTALAYTAFVTPYEVGFLSKRPPTVDALFIINSIINIVFLADLTMNLVLAQFDEDLGMWRIRVCSILAEYVAGWMVIDVISVIPFDLVNLLADSPGLRKAVALRTIRLLRLMRLFRILKAMKILQKWEHKITISYSTQSLIKFAVGGMLLAHWMACVFRFVVDLENKYQGGSPYNWMIVAGLNPSDNVSCYITAFYFAVMTMTTVGYGDISGHTNGEKIVVIMMMLIGAGCFGYVIGAICGLINSLDAEGVSHRELMDSLQAFIKDNNLPKPLAESLRIYFLQSRHLRRQQSYEPLFDYMSPQLKAQTQYSLFSYFIRDVPFFTLRWQGLPSKEARDMKAEYRAFVMKLATVLKQVAFGPHEEVIQKGQAATEMYLIREGKAATNGKILGQGKYFGHEMLMESHNHAHSVVTLTHMEGFVISREDLMSLVNSGQFPSIRMRVRVWACWLLLRHNLYYALTRWIPQSASSPRSPHYARSRSYDNDDHDGSGGDRVQMLLAEDATSEHSENSPLMMRAQSTVSPRRVFVAPSRSSMQQSQPRPMVSHVVDGFDTGNGPFDDELVPAQSPRLPVRERLTSGLNSNQVDRLASKLDELLTRLGALECVTSTLVSRVDTLHRPHSAQRHQIPRQSTGPLTNVTTMFTPRTPGQTS